MWVRIYNYRVVAGSVAESGLGHEKSVDLPEGRERTEKVNGCRFEARVVEQDLLRCRVYKFFAVHVSHIRLEKIPILHEVLVSIVFAFQPALTVVNAPVHVEVGAQIGQEGLRGVNWDNLRLCHRFSLGESRTLLERQFYWLRLWCRKGSGVVFVCQIWQVLVLAAKGWGIVAVLLAMRIEVGARLALQIEFRGWPGLDLGCLFRPAPALNCS